MHLFMATKTSGAPHAPIIWMPIYCFCEFHHTCFYFINISFEGTYGMLKKKLQCDSNSGTWKKVNYDNNRGAEGVLFEAYAYY